MKDLMMAGAQTARLVVEMNPEKKRELKARAKKAGVSLAEFVRRRLDAEDEEDHRDEIELLLLGLEARAPAILATIGQAMATAEGISATLDKMAVRS